VADLADYLDLTVSQAQEQFRALLARGPVASRRQVTFLPVETLLWLAVSFLVNHRHFGGSTAQRAPEPVPSLARLFSRPPGSVLAKMANLDGSRSHGARYDVRAGAILRDDTAQFSRTYRVLCTPPAPKESAPTSFRTSCTWNTTASLPSWGKTNSTSPRSNPNYASASPATLRLTDYPTRNRTYPPGRRPSRSARLRT
jgi:hypothetical protein